MGFFGKNDLEMIQVHSQFGIPSNFFNSSYKTKTYLVFDPNQNFFDKNNLMNIKKKFDKIILIHGCEPPMINDISDKIKENVEYFDVIYTFDESLLATSNKCKLFCFGSCWVLTNRQGEHISLRQDYHNLFTLEKKYKLSFVKSKKNELPGHKLRHNISNQLQNKSYEILFPEFGQYQDKKTFFQDSMFHIAIENSQVRNYFSEKIIDCFMSYTIPIYWGCPNIGDYFNTEGIITFENEQELESILNSLTPETYFQKQDAILDNYRIAHQKFAFFFDRVIEMTKT